MSTIRGEVQARGWEWYYLDRLTHPELRTFKGDQPGVSDLLFSPNGALLASRGNERGTPSNVRLETVRLWDVSRGKLLHPQGAPIIAGLMVFNRDGARLATSNWDGKVRLWDVSSGRLLRILQARHKTFYLVFSPDGGRLASSGDDWKVHVWDVPGGRLRHTYPDSVFSPDGARLASRGRDGNVQLWDMSSGRLLHTLKVHRGPFSEWKSTPWSSLLFSPNGTCLASSIGDGTVQLWDAKSGQLSTILHYDAKRGPRSVMFSPDGRCLASEEHDGRVQVWDVASGRLLHTHHSRSESLRSRDGRIIGTASDAYSMVFSPDGARLASTSHKRPLRLWDVAGDCCLTSPETTEYLTTLGVAQYRLGHYAETRNTLDRSLALNTAAGLKNYLASSTGRGRRNYLEALGGAWMSPWLVLQIHSWAYALPSGVAFLALAHHRPRHGQEAGMYCAWLRYLLQMERWADNSEAQAFLREVEVTLSPREVQP